jgi:ABC-type cobalamin/Fe3+-siderophores transport system ATPase subunit
MSHAITIDALSYRAGRHFAIRDLRMRVPNGSVYGFLGPNGSGKTTTIRLLLGMLPPPTARSASSDTMSHAAPDSAYRSSSGTSLESWTQQWLTRTYGAVGERPTVRVRDVAWIALAAPILLVIAARPRERVLGGTR